MNVQPFYTPVVSENNGERHTDILKNTLDAGQLKNIVPLKKKITFKAPERNGRLAGKVLDLGGRERL